MAIRIVRLGSQAPEAQHLITALARLSKHSDCAVGCYCERADRCHRSVLEELLRKHGARIAGS